MKIPSAVDLPALGLRTHILRSETQPPLTFELIEPCAPRLPFCDHIGDVRITRRRWITAVTGLGERQPARVIHEWRVQVETRDNREVGRIRFVIEKDDGTDAREVRKMVQ